MMSKLIRLTQKGTEHSDFVHGISSPTHTSLFCGSETKCSISISVMILETITVPKRKMSCRAEIYFLDTCWKLLRCFLFLGLLLAYFLRVEWNKFWRGLKWLQMLWARETIRQGQSVNEGIEIRRRDDGGKRRKCENCIPCAKVNVEGICRRWRTSWI